MASAVDSIDVIIVTSLFQLSEECLLNRWCHCLVVCQSNTATAACCCSVFCQVQQVFGHLLESQLQYYEPESFWRVFRLWGQTVNIHDQQDALDFYQATIDQMDEQLKVSVGYWPGQGVRSLYVTEHAKMRYFSKRWHHDFFTFLYRANWDQQNKLSHVLIFQKFVEICEFEVE